MIVDYLNNTVWATIKPSKLGGVGVFAIRDIPKGTIYAQVPELPGVVKVEPEELTELHPEIKKIVLDRVLFRKDGNNNMRHPNLDANLQAFMNHAEEANTDGSVTLKEIKKGEELTENYKEITAYYTEGMHPLTLEHHKKYLNVV